MLPKIVKKSKLRWFGHVVTAKRTLNNTILQGKDDGERSGGSQQDSGRTL